MTSFGTDKHMTDFGFLTTYKIQGQCYHLMGGLLPLPKESHKFVQIYFMGSDKAEAQQRCVNIPNGLDLDIVMKLQEIFHKYHKYVGIFHIALEHIMLIKDLKKLSSELINVQGRT